MVDKMYVSIPDMKKLFPIIWSEGPRRVTIRLVGESGIGKTQGTIQCAEELGCPYILVNVPAEIPEPADLQGQCQIYEGKTVYVPPFWVVDANNLAESTDRQYVILIIDEPSRAPLQILQALMPMALEYRVGSAPLHPKIRQVWLDNPTESAQYNVRSLDFAQEERVQTFHLQYDEDAFFAHALDTIKFHPELFTFLKQFPEMLWNFDKKIQGPLSPRTAEYGSQACYALDKAKVSFDSHLGILRLSARLGIEVTHTFVANLRVQKHCIPPHEILERTFRREKLNEILAPGNHDLCWMTLWRLAADISRREKLTRTQVANVRLFIEDNPSDEINYVFLKTMPAKHGHEILDPKLLARITDRIKDLPRDHYLTKAKELKEGK